MEIEVFFSESLKRKIDCLEIRCNKITIADSRAGRIFRKKIEDDGFVLKLSLCQEKCSLFRVFW